MAMKAEQDRYRNWIQGLSDLLIDWAKEKDLTIADFETLISLTKQRFELTYGKSKIVAFKKDGLKNLRKGAIFTRTRRHPETIEVPSQTEMREILELAVDKNMRKLTKREYIHKKKETQKSLFNKQLKDFDI